MKKIFFIFTLTLTLLFTACFAVGCKAINNYLVAYTISIYTLEGQHIVTYVTASDSEVWETSNDGMFEMVYGVKEKYRDIEINSYNDNSISFVLFTDIQQIKMHYYNVRVYYQENYYERY